MSKNINIQGIILFIVGIIFLMRNIKIYRTPDYLEKYIKTNRKVLLWRKKIGAEKTIKLLQFAIPIGMITSIIMITLGFWKAILPLIR